MHKILLIIKLSIAFCYFTSSIMPCYGIQKELQLSEKYPLIPTPQQIRYDQEEIQFDRVIIKSGDFENEGKILTEFFGLYPLKQTGKQLLVELDKNRNAKLGDEGYQLQIADKVVISANTSKGIFYGIQTLKQLFREHRGTGVFPMVEITDWPAFKIRGFMHDTGRNFQSVAQLKEQIEVMARYKYNVFHWHLTDNPGWRLESKLYPQLQSYEATSRHKGRFYSQQDFKDILAFCKVRNIQVIPEFDIPGHSEAFRKALNIKKMSHPKVKPILMDLFKELMGLANAEDMPYIHIGTDEVRSDEERISEEVILDIMKLIQKNNREVVVWKEGIEVKEDSISISQLWAYHKERKGHRFIDSRGNYINHLDPFAGMSRLFFQQPCRKPKGDSLALGGIIAAWPDNRVKDEREVLSQNPIYPSMVFYADAIWKGRDKDHTEYWAKLPPVNTPEFNSFRAFEEKVITHRDLFFKGKEFQYVKQTDKHWKLLGPLDHHGDFEKSFPVEKNIKASYLINGKETTWTDGHVGGTIHLKHFFDFPSVTDVKSGTFYAYTNIYAPDDRVQDFWVGFQGWSRSGGRRGGPTPEQGDWHTTKPKIWVNNSEIAPPVWKQPGLGVKTDEIPFVDEDYFYRSPTKIPLKKGWNKVLLKIPHGGNSWKWMFTCIPVHLTDNGVREVSELIYSAKLETN